MTATLAWDSGQMSHKLGENGHLSCTPEHSRNEVQRNLRVIAGLAHDDSRKAALHFAASVLRMPFERVRKLFYGTARRVEAHEADRIRAYVEQAHQVIKAREEYDALRAQYIATAHPRLARFAPPAPDGAEIQQDRPAPVKRARR